MVLSTASYRGRDHLETNVCTQRDSLLCKVVVATYLDGLGVHRINSPGYCLVVGQYRWHIPEKQLLAKFLKEIYSRNTAQDI